MIRQEDMKSLKRNTGILMQGDDFIYILPSLVLRGWISNYTITFPGKEMISKNYTVIPHGSATLVISLDCGGIQRTLFGPSTRPCSVGQQANKCSQLFIIEFQPGGLYALTGIPQYELTDNIYPLSFIDSKLDRSVLEIFERAEDADSLIDGIDDLLYRYFSDCYPAELRAAADFIIGLNGNIAAKKVSVEVHFSERHLSRLFNEYLGMNPKVFTRLVRVNKAVRLLGEEKKSIPFIYSQTGYYDASHFTRDFKAICGITPKDYQNRMSDFYNEIAKF